MIYLEEEIRISILDHLSQLQSERISHSSESCNSKSVHQRHQSGVSPLCDLTQLTPAWHGISAVQCPLCLNLYGAATHKNIPHKVAVCTMLLLITSFSQHSQIKTQGDSCLYTAFILCPQFSPITGNTITDQGSDSSGDQHTHVAIKMPVFSQILGRE